MPAFERSHLRIVMLRDALAVIEGVGAGIAPAVDFVAVKQVVSGEHTPCGKFGPVPEDRNATFSGMADMVGKPGCNGMTLAPTAAAAALALGFLESGLPAAAGSRAFHFRLSALLIVRLVKVVSRKME
jgi:hypothetical protein